MIKIEHSLFALPFALASMLLAAKGALPLRTVMWILFCMVCARSGAMGFNRWADAEIDAKNPRTANREIPKGHISKKAALVFTAASFILFIAGAAQLNRLSFYLSPVPIIVFIVYSYTKRLTVFCHLLLGVALGLAPLSAWIAVTGTFSSSILYLAISVIAWSCGFDLFYSLHDEDFDRAEGLFSFPSRFGKVITLITARNMHFLAFILFFLHGAEFSLGWIYTCGLIIAGFLLLYEHYIISKYGLKKLDTAFFNMNAVISIILFAATAGDIAVYGYRG
jgi:4-hydroxybenzoate polyprenyltransferase